MRLPTALLSLLAIAPLALADVKFTVPAAGASLVGGKALTVTWADSGEAPALADLTGYQIFLFAGSNASPQQLLALGTGSMTTGNTLSVTIPITIGGNTANAYFLGITSTATVGGTVTNYSSRFTLTGMTGVFSAAVTTALASVSGTAGPPTVNNVVDATTAATVVGTTVAGITSVAGADGLWATPYDEQTGLTKYAPMQPIPPTKIVATNTSPLWPTSSVVFASTFLPIPTIVTTLTQSGTYSAASHANTAAAASPPADDMQKFLNRWKD